MRRRDQAQASARAFVRGILICAFPLMGASNTLGQVAPVPGVPGVSSATFRSVGAQTVAPLASWDIGAYSQQAVQHCGSTYPGYYSSRQQSDIEPSGIIWSQYAQTIGYVDPDCQGITGYSALLSDFDVPDGGVHYWLRGHVSIDRDASYGSAGATQELQDEDFFNTVFLIQMMRSGEPGDVSGGAIPFPPNTSGFLQPGRYHFRSLCGTTNGNGNLGVVNVGSLLFFTPNALQEPTIVDQPSSTGAGCPDCATTCEVVVFPGDPPATFQWEELQGDVYVPCVEGPNTDPSTGNPGFSVQGQGTPSITMVNLLPVPINDRSFRVVVTNSHGSTISAPFAWHLCLADFDNSGRLAVADIFAFLNAWFAADPRANFDGVHGLQVADIFAFLNTWFAGC